MDTELLLMLKCLLSERGTGKTRLRQFGTLHHNNRFGVLTESRREFEIIKGQNRYALYINPNNYLNSLRGMSGLPITIDDSIILKMVDEILSLRLQTPTIQPTSIISHNNEDVLLDITKKIDELKK